MLLMGHFHVGYWISHWLPETVTTRPRFRTGNSEARALKYPIQDRAAGEWQGSMDPALC